MTTNSLDGGAANSGPGFLEVAASVPDGAMGLACRTWGNNGLGAVHANPSIGLAETGSGEATLSSLLDVFRPPGGGQTLAKLLLTHYGSVANVLAASAPSLALLLGEQSAVVPFLRDVHATMLLALREAVAEQPVLSGSVELRDYLHMSLAHERREIVRLLFLDAKNRLILDEMHSQGSVSHAPVYPREIVRRLIDTNATALIIVHNHPSGDPMPSGPDIEMTRRIAAVLDGLNITLQDSIIIGRFGFTSLRARGLL